MNKYSRVVLMALLLVGGGGRAQEYPVKPVQILTSEPGSSTDFAARLIAQGLAIRLNKAVLVDNRPSNLLGALVSKSAPDGHSLLAAGDTFMMSPLLQKMSYDPINDFLPIILAVSSPNVLVVHPSLPVKSVKELIALAKAHPGRLNFGSSAGGSSTHLAGALFSSMANVNIVWVPYRGSGPAVIALTSGEVQMMITSPSSVMAQVRAARLKALAVASLQPSPLLPGLPTIAATGVPGYEWSAIIGIFAPAKTPSAIVKRLNEEIARVLNQPENKEKFFSTGSEVVASTPEQLADVMKSEISRVSAAIKSGAIKTSF